MSRPIEDELPAHTVESTIAELGGGLSSHPPRILLLYGSLRRKSYSRFMIEEAARVLDAFGAETRIYKPDHLPVFDRTSFDNPEVVKLRALSVWSEAHVWCSPEQHGSMTGVFKNQVDWIPLTDGAVRPTQGRTVAVMQVSGGSQSFNAVNQLRILGRWMRMFVIANQSSVAKAWQEFDDDGRMKESAFRERLIDVMEELFRLTLLLRDRTGVLTKRHSEEKQKAQEGGLRKGLGV